MGYVFQERSKNLIDCLISKYTGEFWNWSYSLVHLVHHLSSTLNTSAPPSNPISSSKPLSSFISSNYQSQ